MTNHFLQLYQGLPALSRFYFVARSAGAAVTGLSGFTIYLAKNGGAAALITPTVAEVSAANMPGVYRVTLTAAHLNTPGPAVVHITHGSMDPSLIFADVQPRSDA